MAHPYHTIILDNRPPHLYFFHPKWYTAAAGTEESYAFSDLKFALKDYLEGDYDINGQEIALRTLHQPSSLDVGVFFDWLQEDQTRYNDLHDIIQSRPSPSGNTLQDLIEFDYSGLDYDVEQQVVMQDGNNYFHNMMSQYTTRDQYEEQPDQQEWDEETPLSQLSKLKNKLVKFASSYQGMADQGGSGQTEEDSTFEEAYGQFLSQDHDTAVQTSHDLASVMGSDQHRTHKGLVDWDTASTAGVVQIVPDVSEQHKADYLAAWNGLQGNHKTVMSFLAHPEGKDSIYTFKVPEKDMMKLRKHMNMLGIKERTMLQDQEGHHILIFDPGSQMEDKIMNLAEAYGSNIRYTNGTGSFYGGSSLKSARAEFRKIIRAVEHKYGKDVLKPMDLSTEKEELAVPI